MGKKRDQEYAEFEKTIRFLGRMQGTGVALVLIGFVPAMFGIPQQWPESTQNVLFLTLVGGVIVILAAGFGKWSQGVKYPAFKNRFRRARQTASRSASDGSSDGSGWWHSGGDSGGDGGGGGD
ncbi:hypothetical protein [Diaminobutyricimonas sp. LJ205]|uniref:hypothetical protein n=1 Tax=Diaminobutyricimonas sp. LJ205 TaxID=2683590 RepID=UPI0012F52B26|nr:hypothetical protein [Diaminobutyricimonas sp. LJ205]